MLSKTARLRNLVHKPHRVASDFYLVLVGAVAAFAPIAPKSVVSPQLNAAAVVAQAVSYLMGFFIAGLCVAATLSSTFTTMDQFSEVRVGAGEII